MTQTVSVNPSSVPNKETDGSSTSPSHEVRSLIPPAQSVSAWKLLNT